MDQKFPIDACFAVILSNAEHILSLDDGEFAVVNPGFFRDILFNVKFSVSDQPSRALCVNVECARFVELSGALPHNGIAVWAWFGTLGDLGKKESLKESLFDVQR